MKTTEFRVNMNDRRKHAMRGSKEFFPRVKGGGGFRRFFEFAGGRGVRGILFGFKMLVKKF